MKQKNRSLVVFLSLSFFIGSLALFGVPQNTEESNETPTTKILRGMHPFYDAKDILEAVAVKKPKIVFKILSKYIEEEIFSFQDAETILKKNPFLIDWLEENKKILEVKEVLVYTVTKKVEIPPSAAKGLPSPVMVVDALGSFIAKRFKEELTIAYLKKFRNKLDEAPVGELFPSARDFLKSSEIFNFKLFIPTLKEAFQNDLNHFDSNLKNFLIKHREIILKDAKTLLKKDINEITEEDLREKKNEITKEIKGLEKKKKKEELSKKDAVRLEKLERDRKTIDYLMIDVEVKWQYGDLLDMAILILDLIQDVKSGKHPADIIDNLSKSDYIDQIDYKISNPIRLLAIFSRSLRNEEGDGWIKLKAFEELFKSADTDFPQLFLGLIYAKELDQLNKIKFKNEPFDKIIDKNKDKIIENIQKPLEQIRKALEIANNIQEKIEKLEDMEKKGKEGFEKYYSYLTTVFELIEHGFDIKDIINVEKLSDDIEKIKKNIQNLENQVNKLSGQERKAKSKELENKQKEKENLENIKQIVEDIKEGQKYLNYAKKLLEILKNIHDKAYGVALVNALEVLKEIFPNDSSLKKEVIKYMSFAVSIVNAKDAKEIQEVLEAAALPVGSYRLKRANFFNISLNAYVGGFLGGEWLGVSEEDTIDEKDERWNAGLAAPIGLAFTWGKSKSNRDKPGPSFSIFASAIDVGAVVNWRLKGEDKGLPEFTWKNVFAPGLFLIYGIKNSSISIGAGIQYGPQLREIKAKEPVGAMAVNAVNNSTTDDVEAVIKSSSFRFGIIIAVDIPIFNIYTREKKGGRL